MLESGYLPPKQSPSPAAANSETERLIEVVGYLSRQAGILIDLIDDVREDLLWLARNGIPHQPLIVHVERMALDPIAPDWGDRLKLSVTEVVARSYPDAASPPDSSVRSIIEAIANPLGEVAPEKLAILISLFDNVKHQVLQAIRSAPTDDSPRGDSEASSKSGDSSETPSLAKKQRTAPPGHLF